MSQENVEIVQAQYASFGQVAEGGKVHSWVLGYFDPNCEYRPVEEVHSIRGHDLLLALVDGAEVASALGESSERLRPGVEAVLELVLGPGRRAGPDD